MQEVWKPIEEFNGIIEASSLGRVRRIHKGKSPYIYSFRVDKNGYYNVHIKITKLRINKLIKVHRLVAKAFIPNPNNYNIINHKNEVKTDNRPENLEWCTTKYNVNYGTGIERRAKSSRNQKHRSCPIIQYSLNGEYIQEFPSFKEVQRYLGKSYFNVWSVCNGKAEHAYGYKWGYKYLEGGRLIDRSNHYNWFKELFGIDFNDLIQNLSFNKANSIKYIFRAGHKSELGRHNIDKEIEDLKKAAWYLEREIEFLNQTLK